MSEDSELSMYIGKGDNRNARLHTKMVANRLNRLPRQTQTPSADNRKENLRPKIREAILGALLGMPVRDEVNE